MSININRTVLDPFYRYKMPRLQAKVEGKGNGIKTVIANMSDIAKALERPPTYPTKYFGCELGAQTNFDLKNERYIVNGEHDANKLQDILDGFIRKFVLCPNCENPETTLQVRKNQIRQACKACGYAGIIDQKHKLSTFILKNPPPDADDNCKKEGGGSPEEENGLGDYKLNDKDGTRGSSDADDNADDDWLPDEAVEKEKTVITGQMAMLMMDKDLDKPVEERLDMLHAFFADAKKTAKLMDTKAMVTEAERLEVKNKAALLLCDVLFNGSGCSANIISLMKEYRPLLLRFTVDDKKAQRHLLGGIEQVIVKNKETLMAKTAHIIKALYDEDIVEEETLLEWGQKPSGKYVKKELSKEIIAKAEPVLKWLKEAEEESEDEDGDLQVDFDDRARATGIVDVNKKPTAVNNHEATANHASDGKNKKKSESKDDDDLNIDDI